MKNTGIIKSAITSPIPLELAYRAPAALDQRGTYVSNPDRPEFLDLESTETQIEFAQLLMSI